MSSFITLPIPWREPWGAINSDYASRAELELQREMPIGHVLFGKSARAIGARRDCDDVMFYLGESAPMFAVVHLTYSKESDPKWPSTQLFDSLQDWIRERMNPDADEWDLGS